MKRTCLRNKLSKNKQRKQTKVFKRKKLPYISYKKDEKRLLQYLRYKKVTDNKIFWKTIKAF